MHLFGALGAALSSALAWLVDPATRTALDELTIGDALAVVPLRVQVALLLLTAGCALWARRRRNAPSWSAFLACAALWSRANHGLEVAVLWSFSVEHGLTVADLAPPALLAVAAGPWRDRWAQRGPRGPRARARRMRGSAAVL